MYVDGAKVKEGSEFGSCSGGCFTVPAATYSTALAAGSTHAVAFEISDASSDGNGVLMKAGFIRNGSPQMMDTTWWCSGDTSAGWTTTAYTDTTNWSHPDRIDAYDPAAGAGSWIYPGKFWFRKKFTAEQATQIVGKYAALPRNDRLVGVKYFTLQGRVVRENARMTTGPVNLLIRRAQYENGTMQEARTLRVR